MAVTGVAELEEELQSHWRKMPTEREWKGLMRRLAIDRWGAAWRPALQPKGKGAASAPGLGVRGQGAAGEAGAEVESARDGEMGGRRGSGWRSALEPRVEGAGGDVSVSALESKGEAGAGTEVEATMEGAAGEGGAEIQLTTEKGAVGGRRRAEIELIVEGEMEGVGAEVELTLKGAAGKVGVELEPTGEGAVGGRRRAEAEPTKKGEAGVRTPGGISDGEVGAEPRGGISDMEVGAEPHGGISDGWVMCTSSRPARHAYPCGLWLLFHTLMAHAEPAHAMQTLQAISGYVDAFFGCDECAAHFHTLTAGMQMQLLSNQDEANSRSRAQASGGTGMGMAQMRDRAELWLWAAHNSVNDRLRTEIASGQVPFAEFAPYQWPSRDKCPDCYDATEVGGAHGHGQSISSSIHHRVMHRKGWVDGAVLDYLHRAYCLEPCFACWGEHERWATEQAATEAYYSARSRIRAGGAGVVACALLLGALACWAWPGQGQQRTGRVAGRSGGTARACGQYWAANLLGLRGKGAKAHHVV
jgi:hypothetical protein